MLKELLEKNCKIHPKTLQKINKQLINNTNNGTINSIIEPNNQFTDVKSTFSQMIPEIINNSSEDNKIIKSIDNKFIVDLNKNFMTFNNKPIKYFYHNDQVYFKAIEVAEILEYIDTNQAIRKNVDNRDKIKISELLKSEHPQTIYINESGFYSIIFTSKKEEAIEFRRWVTSEVLPSIRKTGSYNIFDNYIEEDLDKYYNKDCVYIINIKDDIYKYGKIRKQSFLILITKQNNFVLFCGYTSHIFKRLQAHKTNLKYNKIIKIFEMNNMNEAIRLENKIKKLVKSSNINMIYNNHIEIFAVNNIDLQDLINKIDGLSLTVSIKNKQNNLELFKLKIENENLKLKLELLQLSK